MASEDEGGLGGLRHLAKEDNPFATAVGALLLNFGFIELRSVQWINILARDPLLAGEANRRSFARRCDLIRRLVDREELDPVLKDEARQAWLEAEKLAEFRNKVAHNPLMLGWRDQRASEGPPDFVRILDLRSIEGAQAEAVGLEEIHHNIDALRSLGTRIHELSERIGVTDEIAPWPED